MAFTLARAVFVLRSDPATAAVFFGVIDGGALRRQFPVLAWERDSFRQVADELAAVLGPERYRAAVDHGISLSYEDAVATASASIEAFMTGSTS
jgi:hypothetical protein